MVQNFNNVLQKEDVYFQHFHYHVKYIFNFEPKREQNIGHYFNRYLLQKGANYLKGFMDNNFIEISTDNDCTSKVVKFKNHKYVGYVASFFYIIST